MLKFEEEFFEDEVREGFYVPSIMKHCWAAELDVLYELDRICNEHNIMYFANWGTLLAAVRHGGMIPWDDDIDIVMTRNEFERFYAVAQDELPKEFYFRRFETSETCWQFIVNLMSHSRMCFEPDYLENHYGFPYMAGVDIFILDHYCPDEKKAEAWRNTIKRILIVADLIWEEKLFGQAMERELSEIEALTGARLKREGSLYERRLELYVLAKEECAKFNGETTEYVSQMLPWGIFYNRIHLRKDYEYAIRMPFENIEISVPLFYHKLLTEKYGDYYIAVYGNGEFSHDYPYFECQRKALGEGVYFAPQFHFSKEMLLDKGDGRMPRIKRYSLECMEYFKEISHFLSGLEDAAGQIGFAEISMDELIACQSRAIAYGQYLEEAKGEEFPVIRILERYCEAVFQLGAAVQRAGSNMGGQNTLFTEAQGDAKRAVTDICRITDELEISIRSYILNRNSILFIPYKAKYWYVFHPIWMAAKADAQCDVYVMPCPLHYKKYDGTAKFRFCEQTDYPADVTITPYEEFDFEKTGADVIYFQNPYDNYNMEVGTLPKFYSINLKKDCQSLVYIPYFRENDFEKKDEKQYYNMKYYCTMPGVIYADKIILATKALKRVYIQKLCEFAGEDTKSVWEAKIYDQGACLYEAERKEKKVQTFFQLGLSPSSDKWVLYYTSLSSLCEKKEKALKKIRNVLEYFRQSREGISFIWAVDPALKQYLEEYDKELASEFYHIIDNDTAGMKVVCDLKCIDLLVDFCDAYYGDPSVWMQRFVNVAKPVMVCNYGV